MNEYSKKIHNQATDVAQELLILLADNRDKFIPMITDDESPDVIKAQDEWNADFAHKVIALLVSKECPADYATFGIDKIVDSLAGLKAFIDGTIRSYHDEYTSRSYGLKNEQGKYRRELITVGGLALKLNEVREQTGNNKEDFFNSELPDTGE